MVIRVMEMNLELTYTRNNKGTQWYWECRLKPSRFYSSLNKKHCALPYHAVRWVPKFLRGIASISNEYLRYNEKIINIRNEERTFGSMDLLIKIIHYIKWFEGIKYVPTRALFVIQGLCIYKGKFEK